MTAIYLYISVVVCFRCTPSLLAMSTQVFGPMTFFVLEDMRLVFVLHRT
uniref:Uncharacterized protein n=1 Tax=Aegilops tauschii subsp. strangulata TaxID=200361 RepID=A0A453H846_AEGTS